ncbi:MFS transporter [Alicyclobacillus fodiniaquatilis]|uniref:MFS transporter n=1 Tax=Alicyclobacillus fodiniaquatilis TaxID=1661150 RepID=A0ABW4JGP7_9BACL
MDKFALLQPLRTSRSFTALWGGQLLSGFGNQAFGVILPMVVYTLTGSALTMGVIATLRVIPQILLQPFTGVMADRFPRVSMMLTSDLMRFALLLTLGILGISHHLTIPMLEVMVFVYGAMSVLFRPAYMALRRQIFTPEIRNAAISLTQIGTQMTSLVGPALGGVIMTLTSSVVGFVFDAATFLFSIISLLWIRNTDVHLKTTPRKDKEQTFIQDLMAGYRETTRHPWVWIGILAWTFIIISYSGLIPILLPWLLKVHFKFPDYTYGIVVSMSGIGAMLAGMIVGSIRKWKHRGVISYGAVAIQGFALLAMAFIHWLPGLMLMMAISSAGNMLFGIIHEGILQELVPEAFFGRVISLEVFSASIAQPIGYLLTGTLFRRFGGIHTMMAEAATMCLVAMATLCFPTIRQFK